MALDDGQDVTVIRGDSRVLQAVERVVAGGLLARAATRHKRDHEGGWHNERHAEQEFDEWFSGSPSGPPRSGILKAVP